MNLESAIKRIENNSPKTNEENTITIANNTCKKIQLITTEAIAPNICRVLILITHNGSQLRNVRINTEVVFSKIRIDLLTHD